MKTLVYLETRDLEELRAVQPGPCPFCGSRERVDIVCDELGSPPLQYWRVMCSYCNARGPIYRVAGNLREKSAGITQAVTAWNDAGARHDDLD